MPPRKSTPVPRIFELEITLDEVKPRVWRRVLVPSDLPLSRLHLVIQEAMGWTNSHLHQFNFGDRHFTDPRYDEDREGLEDERKAKLDQLAKVGQAFVYEYDFGDGWSHSVKVIGEQEWNHRLAYPLCIGGARACPPEDVGGPWGYKEFLAALKSPKHEQHEELLTWCGGYFDPKGFDANAVNRALHQLR